MNTAVEQVIETIIRNQAVLNNSPKPGVKFLELSPLFREPETEALLATLVHEKLSALSSPIHGIAPVASRGYLFSNMFQPEGKAKGKCLVQKAKLLGDPHYVQLGADTEYSSEKLQILKGNVKKGEHYVVMDDLIATGGSILAAAKLIRDEGGIVDAAFSLTELTDFNARARLAESGIELVSVLQFTDADLSKILDMQQAYQHASNAPMSFSLSHHQKKATLVAPISDIRLASTSAIKTQATQQAFELLFDSSNCTVQRYEADSAVSCQPVAEQTREGALNRIDWLKQNTDATADSCLVAIENGIRFDAEKNCYVDFVQVAIKHNDNVFEVSKDCCDIPNEIYQAIEKSSDGSFKETWGDAAVKMGLAIDPKDPHQAIVHVSRQTFLYQALLEAAGQLKSSLVAEQHIDKEDSQSSEVSRLMVFEPQKASERKIIKSRPINLYGHGCPTQDWQISQEKVNRNQLKVFQTGDAFTIISPDVQLKGANIHIHVGFDSSEYSEEVLREEALQLCRCAKENGANSITVALPESCHPTLAAVDINELYPELLQESGADQLYFYDANYQGRIHDEMVEPSGLPEQTIKPQVVLCCSANKAFAIRMVNQLRRQGEMVRLYQIDGQGMNAKIPQAAELSGAIVTIVQSTRPNPDDFEHARSYEAQGNAAYFYEVATVAKQAKNRGAETINFVNPYQFSARSDKAENNDKGMTGAYVQHKGLLIKKAGIDNVITATCHDDHTMSGSYTDGKSRGSAVPGLTNITVSIAKRWLKQANIAEDAQIRLVTPDEGAAKRTKVLTKQLQNVLGQKMCQSRVMGEKHRDTHKDDSAKISSLSVGSVGIHPQDKYIITDDETATGTTLCQAIDALKQKGAHDISVIVVHNNLPLDWLERQLCLTRFLYMGASDLHFSDTHEMGEIALNYDEMIEHYHHLSGQSEADIKAKIATWFNDKASMYGTGFESFKAQVGQLHRKVEVHSLAGAFANEIKTKPYLSSAYAFNEEVQRCIDKIKDQGLINIAVYEGPTVSVAAAVAMKLNLPLTIIPNIAEKQVIKLPTAPLAILGEGDENTLAYLETNTTLTRQQLSASLADPEMATCSVIAERFLQDGKGLASEQQSSMPEANIDELLAEVQALYKEIKGAKTYENRAIKLMAVGIEGQIIAGQLSVLLKEVGCPIGIAIVNEHGHVEIDEPLDAQVSVGAYSMSRSALNRGDVVIPVGSNLSAQAEAEIKLLSEQAMVHCQALVSVAKASKPVEQAGFSFKQAGNQPFFKNFIAPVSTVNQHNVISSPNIK